MKRSFFLKLRTFGALLASLAIASACNPAKTSFDENYYPSVIISNTNSAITVPATTIISGASILLKLDLRDQNYNPFISTLPKVSFRAVGGTSTGLIGAVTNGHDGTYTASFTGLATGTATTILADVDGLTLTGPTVQVIASNYSLSQSLLTVSSATVASSGSVAVTLTLKDASGNPAADSGLASLIVFSNSGGTSTGTFSAVVDNLDGTYTSNFTGVTAGTATTISVAVNALPITSVLPTVTVGLGSVSKIVFTASPAGTNTDTDLSTQPALALEDFNSNVMTTDSASSITLTAYSDACTTVVASGLTATTNPLTATNGVATFAGVRVLKTNVTHIGASDGTHTVCSGAISISPGALASISFSTQPAPLAATAGTAFTTQPVIKGFDANSNLVTNNSAASITLTAYSDACTTTVASGISATTNPVVFGSGISTFAGLTPLKSSVTHIGASDGTHTVCSSAMTVGAGAAASMAFTTQPAASNTDVNLTTQPVITVYDTNGNVKTDYTTTISLTANSNGAACGSVSDIGGGISGASIAAVVGVSTFTVAKVLKTSAVRLRATDGTLQVCSNTFTIAAGTVASLAFTTQPVGTNTDSNLTTQPVVTGYDANSNIVANDSATSITLTPYSDTCSTSVASGMSATANPLAFTTGVATFAAAKALKTNVTHIGASDGTHSVCSAAISISPGALASISFSTQPAPLAATAGTAFTTQPVIKGYDANSNLKMDDSTTSITLTAYSDACTTTVASGISATTNPVVFTSGTSSFAATTPLKTSVTHIGASDGTHTACSNALTVSPAGIASIVFSAQPVATDTDSNLTIQPIITAYDGNGNVATNNSAASITLTAYSDACSSAVAGGMSATTNPLTLTNGVATFAGGKALKTNVTHIGASDGTHTVCSSAITVAPGAISTLAFSTQPSTSGDTTDGALATQPKITGYDANGNVKTDYVSAITLYANSNSGVCSNVNDIASGLTATTNPLTAVAGVASFAAVTALKTNTVTLRATDGVRQVCSSAMVISPGVFSLSQSALAVSAGTVNSGLGITATLTAKDANGNANPSGSITPVTFSSSAVGGTGSFGATVNAGSGVFTSTFTGGHTGAVTLSGLINGSLISATQAVTVNLGTATQLVFTGQPGNGIASSAISPQPIVSIEDTFGNVISSGADTTDSITLSLTTGTGAIAGTVTHAASAGVWTYPDINFTTTGSKTITATATLNGSVKTVTSNAFTINPPAPGAFTISSAVGSSGQVALTWAASSNAATYTVTYGTSSLSYPTTFATGIAGTTSTVTGLSNGTLYYFMVTAVNVTGSTNATAEISANPLPAPAAPTVLTATGGAGSMALAWTAATGGGTITYNIYKSTTSGTYGAAIITGQAGTTYTDNSATNGTQYFYVVTASNATGESPHSNEANPPALTIGAPTVVSVVSSSNQAAFTVSGNCSYNTGTVTVKATKGGSNVSTTTSCGTASSPQYSTTLDVSSLADGTLVFSASEPDAAGDSGIASTVSVTKDATAPTAAATLAWSQTSPTTTTTVTATWVKSVSADLNDQKIQFYSDGTCGTTSGALIDLVSSATQSKTFTPGADGIYSFKITSLDNYNNSSTSSCSSALVIDNTAPALATALSMTTPTVNTKSAYSTIPVSGTMGTDAGGTASTTNITINFYLDDVSYANDTTCSTSSVATTTAAPGAAFSVTTSTLAGGGDGVKRLYYTETDAAGNVSACTDSGLYYQYQANPKISFTRMGYTIKEKSGGVAGVQTGTAVTVQRDECGIASTVPVTTSDVSAMSGTNYTASTINVSFLATECSPKTIAASSFTIVDDTVKTGDLFFKATIGTITGGVPDPANPQIAQVNIADTALTGDYMFNQPLYTVPAGATSVTLTIQRAGTPANILLASSVDVAFVDASAIHGTDYTATTQTVNFATTVDEMTITVPIVANTTNVSFIAKLQNPSAGFTMRNNSVAKVRIMNDTTSVCSAVGAPFGGGAGTPGSPYTICTLTQLKQIASNLTKTFKVTADITNDGTLTPLGTLTGNFDGNEQIFYNFTFNGNTNQVGFFNAINTGGTYIKAYNLLNLSMINANSNTGGLVGQMAGAAPPAVSNLLVTGYISGISITGLVSGALVASGSGNPIFSFTNCLTFGTTKSNATVGGVLGATSATAGATSYTFTLSNLYNAANVISVGTAAGGIIGKNGDRGTNTFSNLENRGYITGTSNVGGMIGNDAPANPSNPTLTFSNSANYGTVVGTSTGVAGVEGAWSNYTTTTMTNISNYGAITGAGSTGGLMGQLSLATSNIALTLNSPFNSGAISSSSSGTGGIVGNYNTSGAFSGTTLSIDSATNTGSVTGSHYVGGIAGITLFSTTTVAANNSASITNSSNTGAITGTDATGGNGGVLGRFSTATAPSASLTMTNDTSTTGAISCTLANNCGGLVGLLILNGTETVAISGSSATSNVGGIGELGGLIGITTQTSGASTLNISSSYATGNINATGGHDGGLIGEIDNNTGTFLLTQSHASGSVTTTTNAAGGVVGEVNISGSAPSTTISRSYAAGAVNVKDSSNGSSGFIGNVDMAASSAAFTISDSYSTGPVTGNPAGYVAGMIGNMYDGSIISAGVYYCTVNLTRVYTTSVIAGGSGTSGRIYTGETNCTVNVTDSYWEKDVSVNAGIPDDGYQETAAWLQTQTNYPVGYDFTNIWTMSPGPFPSLR